MSHLRWIQSWKMLGISLTSHSYQQGITPLAIPPSFTPSQIFSKSLTPELDPKKSVLGAYFNWSLFYSLTNNVELTCTTFFVR